jgi:hypothetical protein
MRVQEVAKSHRERAMELNKGHSGDIKEHKAVFYFTDARDALRRTTDALIGGT